ncbi:hypothetical protein INT48_008480 [Thamnidium elegans]|uniref:Jacalin-type lectin domain-containing protein n=1 Tax=Thamnidium elegans TaxID=101142 RepID=A0A8H7SMW9_9FUNG|nr:hypothetical protein INT48_008480 [Thamnidium elegans]
MVHLLPGPNTVSFILQLDAHTRRELHFHVNYVPLLENPALSLVIFMGSDSPGTFDVPPQKRGQDTLSIAVEKLRTAGYMWQAFCAEQMYRNGMGRRTFRLEEEVSPDTVSCQDKGVVRSTAKVHIIRSKHTVAEIRDIRRAQQSDDEDEDFESLFDFFFEDLHEKAPFNSRAGCMVAGLILDSHWDVEKNVTLGHTALGGGAGDTRLGVFGSHLLHAWPTCVEDIVPCFMNSTKTDIRYVANDANESGEWWRAANIGLGAMLHEVGHAYTLSHTPTGVMSRGYNNLNRTYVAKEPALVGPIPPEAEHGSHWHRLDIMRLRFHPGFRIPQDGLKNQTDKTSPSFVPLESGHFLINAPAGISMVEMNVDGGYRTHFEFLQDQPKVLQLSLDDVCNRCQCKPQQKISLQVISINQEEKCVENLQAFLQSHHVRLPGVQGTVIQSDVFGGDSEGTTKSRSIFLKHNQQMKQAVRITVHHGSFLDGFIIHWSDGSRDCVGKTGGARSDFDIMAGEKIQGIVLQCGAWIDGLQFKLSSGRMSAWYGGMGGSPTVVEPPAGYEMIGFFSTANDWLDQIDSAPGQMGHVICPPLLSNKITLSSAGNTNRWVFYGTRKQIIDWMQDHHEIVLENTVFVGRKDSNANTHTELVIDLQYVYDQDQGYLDYVKSYFVSIYDVERVKVEIRPRIESKDCFITALNRTIVTSGTKLDDIITELHDEWFKPAQSYVQQTVDLFNDSPTPSHIISAKPPTSVHVAQTPETTN